MKKQHTNGIIILILLFAELGMLNAQKVEKNYRESFRVNSSTILDIDSKFGEVRLIEGDGNTLEVKANIWVESNREEIAEKLLSNLDAEIVMSDNRVIVKSVFPDKMNTDKKTKFRIDFEIFAPSDINLELSSKYGMVYIEEHSGHADISVEYGTLKCQELTRGKEKPLNTLKLAYSSGSIEETGWLKLDLAYSKLAITEAQALVVLSKYSGLSMDECSSIVLESKYDTYSLGELNNFLGEMKYSNLKIDEISKQFEIESAYTSVKVGEISQDFETIKIENSRGGYK
ncbi:MAG: hypothetical protein ACOCWA_10365, partial [Bacteroidota bacterium]